jgi:cytochrome P450
MVTNQEAQAKAQAEIDSVCENYGRLPTVADKARLPYTEALVLEVLRYGRSVPLNIPHRFTNEASCEVDGNSWIFPENAVVIANLW